jgi:hypothetical protein
MTGWRRAHPLIAALLLERCGLTRRTFLSVASNYIILEPTTVDNTHGAQSPTKRAPARPRTLPCARIETARIALCACARQARASARRASLLDEARRAAERWESGASGGGATGGGATGGGAAAGVTG